jgi:hypothetical protein
MLFTWDTTNLCIVFRGWRITGTLSLIVSLLAIILLTAGYEAVREASRRYEAHAVRVGEGRRDGGGESFTYFIHIYAKTRQKVVSFSPLFDHLEEHQLSAAKTTRMNRAHY